MFREQLILVGGGGHCRSCIDVIEAEGRYHISGIVDMKEKIGERVLGYEVIASDDELAVLAREFGTFFITVGHMLRPGRRKSLFERILSYGAALAIVVSPRAHVARSATLGSGTIVMHGAVVNSCSRIGNNGIINSQALVEHDAEVGDHCHISTAAVVNGGCHVGDACFIGSGSVLVHGVEVCAGAVVGAGAVVAKSIQVSGTYTGVPARLLNRE